MSLLQPSAPPVHGLAAPLPAGRDLLQENEPSTQWACVELLYTSGSRSPDDNSEGTVENRILSP